MCEKSRSVSLDPPDGGWQAFLVAFGAFLSTGIVVGITISYGIIHPAMQERFLADGVEDASSKSALIGSLTLGCLMLLSPVAGILTDIIGIRLSVIFGALTCTGSMLLSSLYCHNFYVLVLTFGILFGCGASAVYAPSLTIVGHYFKRNLTIALGLVECGTIAFALLLKYFLPYLLDNFGLEASLRLLAGLSAVVFFAALALKPLQATTKEQPQSGIINKQIFKNSKYLIWISCCALTQFGYFGPVVHLVKFSEVTFPGRDSSVALICITIGSGITRLLYGFVVDRTRVGRVALQQCSFLVVGICFFSMVLNQNSFYLLLFLSFLFGLCDGFIIASNGAIAIELCGAKDAAQAIGFNFGLGAVPLVIGPTVTGKLYDATGNYNLGFIICSVFLIVGGAGLSFIRCAKPKGEPLARDDGKTCYCSCLQ